jgi:hypothetical protein
MAKKAEAKSATETQRRRVEKQSADAGNRKSDTLRASVPLWQKPSALLDTRVVYCGDNLEQLAKLPDACVDLIYIDPPFNSNRNYEGPSRTGDCWGETKEKRAFADRHKSTYPHSAGHHRRVWKRIVQLFILLASVTSFAKAADVQIKSKWDADLLNVTIHNVSIKSGRMQTAWEEISKQYLLRANFYMDAGSDSDTTTFEFKKELATGKELLEAFLAAFPAYTYTQNQESGVIWIHPKRINYEDILNQKIKIDRPAHQVPMYRDVYIPLLKLLDPNVVDSYDSRARIGYMGMIDPATGKPPIPISMFYDVDLPAGVYSAREILDFCCVANPSKAFVIRPVYGKKEPLVIFLEGLLVYNPLVPPRDEAVRFWELEIGKPTNGIPGNEEVRAAMSDTTNPEKRLAASLYVEACDNYSPAILIGNAAGSEQAVWTALEVESVEWRDALWSDAHARFFTEIPRSIPRMGEDLKKIENPDLALLVSLQFMREKLDTSYLDDIVNKHTYTKEEIASIKPELVRAARSSEIVRDKLKEMKLNVPELSPAALNELANTNYLTLVPANIK